MSPVDAAIVRRKLGHIMTSLDLLRPMRAISLQDYRRRVWDRKGVERLLQEAIEAALDVNAHLIAELGHDVPDDYSRSDRSISRRLKSRADRTAVGSDAF